MAELELSPLTNIESQTSFLDALNANLEALRTAVNDKLDRGDPDLTQMATAIDMNSKRVMNLPSPEAGSDAARWIDVYAASVVTEYAIPNPVGNENKYLTNDGLALYWSNSISGLLPANNLSDLTNPTQARINLGLGTSSVYDVGGSGSKVPLLSNTNTWAAQQTWVGPGVFQGGGQLGGSSEWRVTTTGLTTLSSDSVGYRGAPQNLQDANYTLTLDDAGKGISHSSASTHTWTIPPDSDVNFPNHTVIVLDNYGTGAVTVARGSGVTLRINGSGTSANQTLNQYFVRSIYKIGANFWVYN